MSPGSSRPSHVFFSGAVSALDELSERSGIAFPHLDAARRLTSERIEGLRHDLSTLAFDADVSVVLFGSWARRELTVGSDADWAVLVEGPERLEIEPSLGILEQAFGGPEGGPGAQGVFGKVVFCDHLVERIGLDADDNSNLTRRILLLLESVAVSGDAARERCWQRVLDGYLDGAVKDFRPPRFFLNDLIRYWRTICVDYVGKEREATGQKWAIRNLKLATSRKVLFAAGLLPILLCHRYTAADVRPYLARTLARPAVDRLAEAFLQLDAVDAGVRSIGAYDRFLGLLADRETRRELERMSRSEAAGSRVFQEGRRFGQELDQGLLSLLFETPLEAPVREYGIF